MLVVIATIYLFVIYKGEINIPLSDLTQLSKSVAIVFFVTVLVNITFVLLFPILGKEDPSLQLENEKTSKQ